MKKLILIGLISTVAVVAIAKKTNVCSYATTFIAQVERDTKSSIPTKFELDRIRHEIGGLDSDINQMIRPIAEYKVVIEKMRKDITKGQTDIDEQKKTLLGVVEDLQAHPNQKQFSINGKTYSAERIRNQVQRDTENLKRLDKSVRTQQQVLEAKETSLAATQEQLAKLIAKKREYELRLAQLEAEEEQLQTERIGSHIKIDSGRATQIETALAELEQNLKVAREEAQMRNNNVVNVPLHERNVVPTDLQSLRNYLQGTEQAEKTANNK